MITSEAVLQKLMAKPDLWIHVPRSKSHRSRRALMLEQRRVFNEVITALKLMQIPYQIRDNTSYVLRITERPAS